MPRYQYIARTLDGTLEKGIQNAKSPEMAKEQLRKKGLIAEELRTEDSVEEVANFSGSVMPWTATDEGPVNNAELRESATLKKEYLPLQETIRLFAGWLLAWYSLVYLLGSLQMKDKLSFDIPFLSGLFLSPLVLRFAFGTFFLLLLMTIHRWMKGGAGKGVVLSLLWIAGVAGYGMFV